MNKIWVVARSEFLRRVQNKWFILSTLLLPLFIIAMAVIPALLGVMASESGARQVAVVDSSHVILAQMIKAPAEGVRFFESNQPVDSLRAATKAKKIDGYLIIPASMARGEGEARYYSVQGSGLSLTSQVQGAVDRAVEQHRLAESRVTPELLEILKQNVKVRMLTLTEQGEQADTTIGFSVVGYIMGFFIYMAMFIYGSLVMQGVMEEKQSRVVEVIVSSVRPFQLLMGKVLGIGAMGLVQMAIWSMLILAGLTMAGSIASTMIDPSQFNLPASASQEQILAAADIQIPQVSPLLFVWFVLFFLGGYLLYASLFAAVGSAVEQQQDAQSLMMPITLPILIPILFMMYMIERPDSTASIIMSFIPLFSPILMVVRTAVSDVPVWEVLLALVLLAATFVGAVWLSARIYRVGILMYGKKPTFKDLARWVRFA